MFKSFTQDEQKARMTRKEKLCPIRSKSYISCRCVSGYFKKMASLQVWVVEVVFFIILSKYMIREKLENKTLINPRFSDNALDKSIRYK